MAALLWLLPLAVWAQTPIAISLANRSPREQATEEQLLRLLQSYDLNRWTFTTVLRIEEGSRPHSHPVLTLNTRHLDDDRRQLSTFLHEQIHWHLAANRSRTEQAFHDLRRMYPTVPDTPPTGASSVASTYLHLLVNALEYDAMKALVGVAAADEVFEFWATDHYTWIYQTVLTDEVAIAAVLEKHDLQID